MRTHARIAALLLLALVAVGCSRSLDREQAQALLESKLFHTDDWKWKRLEHVTGVTMAADGKSAVIEFKFTIPKPDKPYEERSYMAKIPARVWDEGWRLEGEPVVTGEAK